MNIFKKEELGISELEMKEASRKVKEISGKIKSVFKKKKIKAELFIGGSFAKGTLLKKEKYDVDLFVRFDKKEEDISKKLYNALKQVFKDLKVIKGSREYFSVMLNDKIELEIIPVRKISNPKKAENVTDLSYFHVNYVKRKLKSGMALEVLLAKKFCDSSGLYGAESYIQGFSGYALECLIIHYKTFEKFLKAVVRVEDRIVLDPEKMYKNKKEILIELNESKTQNKVVLVDPTWKERNVLAALSEESFKKFQEIAKKYLKSKDKDKFFRKKEVDESDFEIKARKMNAEFVKVVISTEKQEGDIAGTKMKKFANFLVQEISKYYELREKEFEYGNGRTSKLLLIVKPRKEILKAGPPVEMKDAVLRFKGLNGKTFVKSGRVYSKVVFNKKSVDFLKDWISSKNGKRQIEEMGMSRTIVS